jgi:hypothetical protein
VIESILFFDREATCIDVGRERSKNHILLNKKISFMIYCSLPGDCNPIGFGIDFFVKDNKFQLKNGEHVFNV